MKLGMTGNRYGIEAQALTVLIKLLNARSISEVHHGDCVGADEAFHNEAIKLKLKVIVHPPDKKTLRAFCDGSEIREEKPYIKRNHDIVDESDILFAFPSSDIEYVESGTWATIRYARKKKKPVLIILPNGIIKKERM
jgi:hypothetical protein